MNGEKIEILNTTSLLGLKAELLRKREEVSSQSKEHSKYCGLRFKNQGTVKIKSKKLDKEPVIDLTAEERELEKLSRTILKAKSQIYDKLCSKELVSDGVHDFLVNFNEKEEYKPNTSSDPTEINCITDVGDGWVEYVDSFGRTRRCKREELPFYKKLDSGNTVKSNEQPEKDEISTANEELVSWEMKREELRKKWEEEVNLLSQKSEVHYEDILFEEARQHGTGYYKFSKDEEERARQQEELRKLREETRQEQRKLRKELGLPEDDQDECKSENDDETKKAELNSTEDLNSKIRENLNKISRLTHVRPWDVGKTGNQPLKVMSQEEWNEMKRLERPEEFAPPSFYKENVDKEVQNSLKGPPLLFAKKLNINSNNRNSNNNISSNDRNNSSSNDSNNSYNNNNNNDNNDNNKNESESNLNNNVLPQSQQNNDDISKKLDILMPNSTISSSDNTERSSKSVPVNFKIKRMKLNNFTRAKQFEPTPIVPLENGNDKDIEQANDIASLSSSRRGVEIPPPLSFDYMLPSNKRKTFNSSSTSLAASVEAGLKFLQREAEINEMKLEKGFLI